MNSLLPPNSLSTINIEIAHVRSWSSNEALASAEESLLIAKELCQGRGIPHSETTVSMLVDDKALAIPDRDHWLGDVKSRWPHVLDQVDVLCFESDLAAIADLFIDRLRALTRGRRAREIEKYRNKHGRIACSHDIAIWHSFRLGKLGRHDQLLVSTNAGRHTSFQRFYASNVVSILEEDDREDEERAREMLSEAEEDIGSRVETIFYAP